MGRLRIRIAKYEALLGGPKGRFACYGCRRRLNFDPPCRLNFDPGMDAGIVDADCG